WMAHSDGSLFWYNDRWYEYTGMTPESQAGWGWQAVHDPNELPRVIEKWKQSLSAGTPWEDTFPLRRYDGEFRWHLSRARPFRNADGEITLWFGTNTDITDQRNLAREREELLSAERAARAQVEHISRMKDEFLATLSHELRTPLTAILGWSQIIKNAKQDPVMLSEGVGVIERNARAQAKLIDDLLDMSRIISGKIRLDVQRVDLAGVVNAAIESALPSAQAKGVHLRKVLDPLTGPIAGDPNRLQQIIWNLLSNAVKFTSRDGKVDVLLERVNSHVQITVSDTGQGISPEFLPHVFDRFRQADSSTTREFGGLGLGLAIVKQLVELHGGNINVASGGKGLGATFTVTLPLAAMRHGDEPREHPTSSNIGVSAGLEGISLKGVKVMVVDDEHDARQLIQRLLVEREADVLVAESASRALEILQDESPDVLLSDIGMPQMDGYEFIRKVRSLPFEKGGRTPAVALTAFARSEDRTRAMMAGYQVHLAKPVEPQELVATVASIVGVLTKN
ncbi:MAG TPA: ATP-binding protein, partial [Tepidisphaeraceae bacterium]|nr:ATP-binding protein [Tepidisphaeraceae bacterium]